MNEFPVYNPAVALPQLPIKKMSKEKVQKIWAITSLCGLLLLTALITVLVVSQNARTSLSVALIGLVLSITGATISIVSSSNARTKINQALPYFHQAIWGRYSLNLDEKTLFSLMCHKVTTVNLNGWNTPLELVDDGTQTVLYAHPIPNVHQ